MLFLLYACMSLQGMFLVSSKDDSEGRRCQAVLILSQASPSQVKPWHIKMKFHEIFLHKHSLRNFSHFSVSTDLLQPAEPSQSWIELSGESRRGDKMRYRGEKERKKGHSVDHGLINYIDTKAKCHHLKELTCKVLCGRCVSEFIDRRYTQSCSYFRRSFVNCCTSNFISGSTLEYICCNECYSSFCLSSLKALFWKKNGRQQERLKTEAEV